MSVLDDWIEFFSTQLPETCTPNDLVSAGIYRTPQAAAMARYAGLSPDYFKIGGRIVYPKTAVIEWLKQRKHENNHQH